MPLSKRKIIETDYDFSKLKIILKQLHLTHTKFLKKYCPLSRSTLEKTLRNEDIELITIEYIILALDHADPDKQYTIDDICELKLKETSLIKKEVDRYNKY